MKKAFFLMITLAIAIASAKTYEVTLFQPSVLKGTELKPGEYKLDIEGSKIVLKSGKVAVESEVTVETSPQKIGRTTVRLEAVDGKNQIREIRVGGTNLKVIVN